MTLPIRRNGQFKRLVVATFSNELAQGMSFVAIPIIVLTHGASATSAGIVVSLVTLAGIVSQVFSGALADHYSPSALLRAGSAVQSLAMFALGVAMATGFGSVPLIALLCVTAAVAASVSGPAEHSIINKILPADDFAAANATIQAREATAGVMGGPVAGAALAVGSAIVVVVQAILHALGTGVAPGGVPASREADSPEDPFLQRVLAGFRYVWRHLGLRILVTIASLINLPFAMIPLLVISYYAKSGMSTLAIGVYSSAMAVGIVLGSTFATRITDRYSIARIGLVSLIVLVLSFFATALAFQNIVATSLISLAAGVCLPAFNACIGSYTMLATPDAMIGRVVAASGVPGMILMPLGAALAGFLFDLIGPFNALILATLFGLPSPLAALSSTAFRTLPRLSEVVPADSEK